MPASLPPSVRRVTDPADPALREFGRIQNASYYDPGSLIPARFFSDLVAGGWGERQNRILVAEDAAGRVLGGTVFHLLPGAGFTSFTGVAREAQGQGVGWALHRGKLAEVEGAGLPGIFADSVYADRQDTEDRAAEVRVGSDAARRRAALHAWGLRTVDLPYWQPAGGPDGGPLTDLDLLYQPLDGSGAVPLALVTATLRAYWSGWLGEARADREAAALAARTPTDPVPLLPATETPSYWQDRSSPES